MFHREKKNSSFSLKKWNDLAILCWHHFQATISWGWETTTPLDRAANLWFATVSTTPYCIPDTEAKCQLLFHLITVKRKSKVLYLYAFHGWVRRWGDRVNPGSDIWVTWLAPVNIYVWNCYLRSSLPSGSLPCLTELVVSFEMLSTRRFP